MLSNHNTKDDRPSTSRKRKILTLKTKVHIIKKFEDGEKISHISKSLSLPNSTVSSIIRDKKRILAASKNTSVLNSSTIIRKRHGIIAQMECTLKTWVEEQTEHNIRLTRNDICTQAKILFEALKRDYGDVAKDETFLASKGWYFRFKQRCDSNRIVEPTEENLEDEISDVQVKIEKKKESPSELDNMEVIIESPFSNQLKEIIEDGGYTSQTVFNVDEIGMYWKNMPQSSHLACNENDHGFNESKDRLTILLGGNATGDLKFKPVLIYRIENPAALQHKTKGGLPVVWKSNSKASMTASLFEDWFGQYFIPEVERYCYANNIPCKVLLVIDSAVYHPPTTLIDFDHRVKVVFLPSAEVSSIQPMCQEISTIFKVIYTRRVFVHLNEAIKQNDSVTVEELWREFNILDAIRIIVDSWADISQSQWNKSWNKLCPYFCSIEDSAENNMHTAIIEEIVNLAMELDMKINRKDISELLDSHNKEPTIEEIIEMQEYSANEEIDIHDPLQPERTMTANNLTEALSHIKTGLQILETIDINEQRARTTRLGVMKLIGPYEELLNEKIKQMAHQDDTLNIESNYNT